MNKSDIIPSTAAERRAEKEIDDFLRQFNAGSAPKILADLREIA